MHLALSLFLLATPVIAQNEEGPHSGLDRQELEALPPVGSAAAIESQEAFREWNAKVTATPQPHFQLDYQGQIGFSYQEGEFQTHTHGTLQGGGSFLARSLREFQHRMNFEIDGEGVLHNRFTVDLLMDGSELSAVLLISNVEELLGGIRVFGNQKILEDAYRSYVPMAPRIVKAAMIEEGIPPEVAPFLDSFMALYSDLPTELAESLHPVSYWAYGLRFFTCRDFQAYEGSVLASLTLDFQEGSELRKMGDALIEGMLATNEMSEQEVAALQMFEPVFHSLVDEARLVMRFDEATGIPLELKLDFEFNTHDFIAEMTPDLQPESVSDLPGILRLTIGYQGVLSIPEQSNEVVFRPQPETEQSMDVTGIVQLGMTYIRNLVEEQEASEDMEF